MKEGSGVTARKGWSGARLEVSRANSKPRAAHGFTCGLHIDCFVQCPLRLPCGDSEPVAHCLVSVALPPVAPLMTFDSSRLCETQSVWMTLCSSSVSPSCSLTLWSTVTVTPVCAHSCFQAVNPGNGFPVQTPCFKRTCIFSGWNFAQPRSDPQHLSLVVLILCIPP